MSFRQACRLTLPCVWAESAVFRLFECSECPLWRILSFLPSASWCSPKPPLSSGVKQACHSHRRSRLAKCSKRLVVDKLYTRLSSPASLSSWQGFKPRARSWIQLSPGFYLGNCHKPGNLRTKWSDLFFHYSLGPNVKRR